MQKSTSLYIWAVGMERLYAFHHHTNDRVQRNMSSWLLQVNLGYL